MRLIHIVTTLALTLIVLAMVVKLFRESKDTLVFIPVSLMVGKFRSTETIWLVIALLVGASSAAAHGVLAEVYQVTVVDDPFHAKVPAPWTQLPFNMAYWPMFAAAAGTALFFGWRLLAMSRRRSAFEWVM